MKFSYSAYDKSGRASGGTIEAADLASATDQLRAKGLFVSQIREGVQSGQARAAGPRVKRLPAGMRLKNLSIFTRQLSILVSTGTPLVQAIEAAEKQSTDQRWRAILADVRRRVEEGVAFSEALSAHPEAFDPICRSLILAGESGGKLDLMLANLADLSRQQLKVRSAMLGAMVYPCLLVCVAVTVSITMIAFVMPRFRGLFENLDTPLPPTTKLLMDLSDQMRTQWMFYIPALALAAFGAYVWARSDRGVAWIHANVVRIPKMGGLVRGLVCARMVRVLGVLIEGRVPLLEALALTRGTLNNQRYAALMQRAEEAVVRGANVSDVLADPLLVPVSVTEALRSGERSGRLAPVLLGLAQYMDEDNDIAVRSLTSILEPVILLMLGLVVGTVAISMFLPLFDLASAGTGGAH